MEPPRNAGQEAPSQWWQSSATTRSHEHPQLSGHYEHPYRGDVGLQQMWPRNAPLYDNTATAGDFPRHSSWRSKEMQRQSTVSDYPESRSYSSHSATSSTNLPCYATSIEYQGNDFKDDAMYSHQLKECPTPAKPPILKSTTIRNEAASHVMHADQRQHSTVSTASSAISSKSHTSISSNHSRMTSKFPVPRLLCSGGSARPGFHENTSSKLLLSRPEAAKVRADVAAQIAQQDAREQKARWTKAKWLLLLSVAALFSYGLAGLLLALLTWFRTWSTADVLIVAENEVLVYITLASGMCIVTALVGLVGTMLNSRPILAVYNLLLWPSLAAILVIGYTSYRKQALNLDRKLNQAWSQFFDDAARLRLQNSLHCCGYYSPLHQATFSKRCYPRTALPGCKGKLFRFEKDMLHQIAMSTFAVVPIHLFNIFIALLCSNHVNRTFGKGLMPRQYRLSIMDVRENAILALRTLPAKPEGIKKAPRKRTESGKERAAGVDINDSMSTGIRMIAPQQEWARLRSGLHAGATTATRRARPSSPTESLKTLPRYSGNLKGLGLF